MSDINRKKRNSVTPFERYSELKKSFKLTQKQIAEHVGVSLEAVKKWTSNKNIPESHYGTLAELFNVDTAYLTGQQDFEKMEDRIEELKQQSLFDSTSLSPEAVNLLMDDKWNTWLDYILSNPHFLEILSEFESYNGSLTNYQLLTLDMPGQCISESDFREIHKNKVKSIFDKLIDDLYEHTPTAYAVDRFSKKLYQIYVSTNENPHSARG